MTTRQRLSATIDADLLNAGRRAVREGQADSLSAWVNDALKRQADHDRRMKAMDRAIREYEAEFGVITDEEIRETRRRMKDRAIRIRPAARKARSRRRGAGGAA